VTDFDRLLELARALGDPERESAALHALAALFFYSHRLGEMVARAEEAIRIAERAGSPVLRAQAMLFIVLKHFGDGELTALKPILEEIIQTARATHHKPLLCAGLAHRGALHSFQSEYELAEPVLTEALALARELRDSFTLLISLFQLGIVQGNRGRFSDALATFHEAVAVARRNGDRFFLPRFPNCIGWLYCELQDFEQALKWDQQSLEIARECDVAEAEANSLINLGSDFAHMGEDRKTMPAFREVEACFQRDAWSRWRYNLRLQAGTSEYWLSQGDPEQAQEHANRLLEEAGSREVRKYIATAYKLLAEAAMARGDLADAEVKLAAALDLLHRYPAPLVAWRTYVALGRLRRRTGDGEAARGAFAPAAAIVGEIAANVREDELRATFLNSTAVREVFEGAKACTALD
jgi:tetratricopeptide (TPR) repeat protein